MKILAGNWKMYKTRAEAQAFFAAFKREPLSNADTECIVCASPTLLESSVVASEGSGIRVYSQNCAWDTQGAYTGEISPLQLKDIGVKGTLVGHSERRQYFNETDESCRKRSAAALEADLRVIYCIGESLAERKGGVTRKVLQTQLQPVLELKADRKNFVLAYEPVWAIGTGLTAETPQVEEAHRWIAEMLTDAGLDYPILYGGSVKPNNFAALAALPKVSGGLVGGASLEIDSYRTLFQALAAQK